MLPKMLSIVMDAGKGDRERWAVEEFLKHLPIDFACNEVISLEEAHSTDVRFRDANFQVKEITNPNTGRQQEFSEIARRVARAKRLTDTLGPAWAYDMGAPVGGDALIEYEARQLSADPRYFPSRATTDLIFYVTHTRATLPSGWNFNAGALAALGWRSISCLIKDQALVLSAHQSAQSSVIDSSVQAACAYPSFLRAFEANERSISSSMS